MEKLIQELLAAGVLTTPYIVNAFRAIDRADFVPLELQDKAYENIPLPLGHDATISQPYTVAHVLELLRPKPGDRVLDIGSGSGWQTALLAYLVTHDETGNNIPSPGHVFALEIIPELVEQSKRNLAKYAFIDKEIVTVLQQNAQAGLPEYAPYDCIVAAAAVEKIPPAWTIQLKEGGRLVAPRGNSLITQHKISSQKVIEREYPGFVFVPFVADRSI